MYYCRKALYHCWNVAVVGQLACWSFWTLCLVQYKIWVLVWHMFGVQVSSNYQHYLSLLESVVVFMSTIHSKFTWKSVLLFHPVVSFGVINLNFKTSHYEWYCWALPVCWKWLLCGSQAVTICWVLLQNTDGENCYSVLKRCYSTVEGCWIDYAFH